MDEPPKKRRFWQLHLSTAVLLMFVAKGLVWLNNLGSALPISANAA